MVEAIHCHPVWICREKRSLISILRREDHHLFQDQRYSKFGLQKKVIGFVQFRDLANGVFKLCVFMLSFKWFIEREHEK